jgi:hypothetical protein
MESIPYRSPETVSPIVAEQVKRPWYSFRLTLLLWILLLFAMPVGCELLYWAFRPDPLPADKAPP